MENYSYTKLDLANKILKSFIAEKSPYVTTIADALKWLDFANTTSEKNAPKVNKTSKINPKYNKEKFLEIVDIIKKAPKGEKYIVLSMQDKCNILGEINPYPKDNDVIVWTISSPNTINPYFSLDAYTGYDSSKI
jgi:hypothetical protein